MTRLAGPDDATEVIPGGFRAAADARARIGPVRSWLPSRPMNRPPVDDPTSIMPQSQLTGDDAAPRRRRR